MDNIVVSFEEYENLYKLAKKGKLKELRLELVMSALFPNVYKNVMDEMKHQFTLGYAAGLKDAENERSV